MFSAINALRFSGLSATPAAQTPIRFSANNDHFTSVRFGEKNFRGLASHTDKLIRDTHNLLDIEETTDAQMDFEIKEAIQEDHESDMHSQREYSESIGNQGQ